MAISPGIPTSFVPKQPVQTPTRKVKSGNNMFLLASLGILGVSILAAVGIFGYEKFLEHAEMAKSQQLEAEQNAVDANTVRDYVRLKSRFDSGEMLLDNHIYISRFLDELEKITLQNVQFNTLHLTVVGDGSAKVELQGTAKNLNALAVEDNTVAADPNFMQGIFSGIGFDQSATGGSTRIKFMLTANLAKDLIHVSAKESQGVLPTVTSAPVTPAAPATTTATTTL